MCPRGGGLRDAEALRQRDPAGDGAALGVGALTDLALQYPRGLKVARDSGEVIKIIWHMASLDGLVRLAASIVSLDDLARLNRLAR